MNRAVYAWRFIAQSLIKTQATQNSNWISENRLLQTHQSLQLLEKCKSLKQLKQILSYITVTGLHRNPFAMSRVLHCCTINSPHLDFALLVFNQIEKPNSYCWNTMIRGFSISINDHSSIAIRFYCKMLGRGALPSKHTFPFLLKACGSLSDLELGKLIHSHVLILGFGSDLFVQTGLVHMYGLCGSLDDARLVFDKMSQRDVTSWTSMISCCSVQGCFRESLVIFNKMRAGDLNPKPNVATMVSVISACANLGGLEQAKSLHAYLEKLSMRMDVFICNSLIDMYAKCGCMDCARQVFDGMPQRDSFSWTALITGLAIHGLGREAVDAFSRMKLTEATPDSVTFIAVLLACSHAGLVDEGMTNFESMEREFKIVPEIKHYGCMVDLFGRAGMLHFAYEFVRNMPLEPNLAIWGSLLSSCRVHGDLQRGEAVLTKIESLGESGGAHVLLSNIYANADKWDEVLSLRKMMRGEKKKPPGRSWIEVKGVINEFIVGDNSHPQIREIYYLLDKLGRSMRRV